MRLKRTVMLLAVTAILAVWQVPASAQEGAPVDEAKLPRIQVSETDFEFGRVVQGASISHVFWIKNVGADTLFIQDIKPG
jgi:hypothetical protein